MKKTEVVIVGAGLAGLAAALKCEEEGIDYLLIEKSSTLGGKLKTVEHNGIALDVGFQVIPSSYSFLKKLFSLQELKDLKPNYFSSTSLIHINGEVLRFGDPLRDISVMFSLLKVAKLKDLILLVKLRLFLLLNSVSTILNDEELNKMSAMQYLTKKRFSMSFIRKFLEPFFAGVFGSKNLKCSAANFLFCLQAFLRGKVFIPENGINSLPQLFQQKLSEEKIFTKTEVTKLSGIFHSKQKYKDGLSKSARVTIETDKELRIEARHLILSTEIENSISLLSPEFLEEEDSYLLNSIQREKYWNIYFCSNKPVHTRYEIFLNANSPRIINKGVQVTDELDFEKGSSHPYIISLTCLEGDIQKETIEETSLEELKELFPHLKQADIFHLK
ncbi:MAG TPA: FAD-dependent oxidoreductase, partial [Vampirovibrionales bacterium]